MIGWSPGAVAPYSQDVPLQTSDFVTLVQILACEGKNQMWLACVVLPAESVVKMSFLIVVKMTPSREG